MKTIYISGPMRTWPNSNLEEFDKAEKQLKQLGFDVLNPHKICEEVNMRFFEMGKNSRIRGLLERGYPPDAK